MKKIIVSTLALSAIFLAGCTQAPTKNLDAFAKCLTEKGAMIYTSPTCTHCQAQKKLFGDSWQYIKDVDCMANPTQCSNIKAVPNRVINGENLVGEQSLETLAAKTACPL
jgi:glutaredoxin